MSRSTRLFEIIQLLRTASRPVTAAQLAGELEVTKRTVYRDIASLQGLRVPIEGEAGIGYVMRAGFDLPPLMFEPDEVEAIIVGLALIDRTGDAALIAAAERAGRKINEVLPDDYDLDDWPIYVSDWSEVEDCDVSTDLLRQSIRDAEKLDLTYADANGEKTRRRICPLAAIYYVGSIVVAAWCELREDFRHFRVDRMISCRPTGLSFADERAQLHREWLWTADQFD